MRSRTSHSSQSECLRVAVCAVVLCAGVAPAMSRADSFFSTWEEKGLSKAVEEAMESKWRDTFGEALDDVYEPAGKAFEAAGHAYDIDREGMGTIDRLLNIEKSGETVDEIWDDFVTNVKKKTQEMVEGLLPGPVKEALDKFRGASDTVDTVLEDGNWAAGKVDKAVEGGVRVYEAYFGNNATEAFEEGSADRQVLNDNSSLPTQGYLPPEVVEDFVDPESPKDYQAFVDVQEVYDRWESEQQNYSQHDSATPQVMSDPEPQEVEEYAQTDEDSAGRGPSAFAGGASATGGAAGQSQVDASSGKTEPDVESEVDDILADTLDRLDRTRENSGVESRGESRRRLAMANMNSSAGGWSNALTTIATGTAIASDSYNRGGAPSPLLSMLPNQPRRGAPGSAGGSHNGNISADQCQTFSPQFDINRCEDYRQCSRLQLRAYEENIEQNREALGTLAAKDRADYERSLKMAMDASRELIAAPCNQMASILEQHQALARAEAQRTGTSAELEAEMRRRGFTK